MNKGTGSLDYRKSLQPSNVGEYQTQTEASAYLHQGAERIHPSLGRYQDMHEYIDHAKEVGGKTLEQLDNAIKTGNVAEILMQTSRYQTQKHGTEEQVDNLPAMIDASVDKVNMLVTKEYPELQGVETPLMIFPSNNFLRDVDYAGSEHRTLPHLTTRISDRGFGAVQDGTIDLEERINLSIVQQFADNNKAHFDEHNNNWTPFTDEGKQAADKAINELMQKLGYSEEKYPAQKPEGKEVTEAASREVKRIEIDLPAQR
jgi:hypothetical protein